MAKRRPPTSNKRRGQATPGPTVKTAGATNPARPNSRQDSFLDRWGVLLASAIIVLAASVAYYNSFTVPFIADDRDAIARSTSIRHWGTALFPPANAATGGRPFLNLTYAFNYALGGLDTWGYHAFNLLVHTLAGLTLFGVVRRTLQRPALRQQFGPSELPLALSAAVLWTVHPLLTQAVTFISERAESLMGLFYLLTLYCFIRSADETGGRQEARGESPLVLRPLASRLWPLASVFTCLLGTLTKEPMVTAPVLVLLYDRVFFAGSFRRALQWRWPCYLGLAGTWPLLACLMTGLGHRGAGYGAGVTWWQYGLTSCRSIALYLKLAIWPHPLVFDYGSKAAIVQNAAEIAPQALILTLLLAATLFALWRRPAIGFAGAWIFIILAPTSSVVPVIYQPTAEYRAYLPLAGVVVLISLVLYCILGKRSLILFAIMAAVLGGLTIRRNDDYRSEEAILRDTIAKCPNNDRAHNNLGNILAGAPEHLADAIAEYEAALRANPRMVEAHNNLGNALVNLPGRMPDAIAQYETSLQIDPNSAEAHYDLASALVDLPGRLSDAITHYEAAVRLEPNWAEIHNNFGYALTKAPGRLPDAVAQFETAVQLDPNSPKGHKNLGNALLDLYGRVPDAIAQFEIAAQLDPNSAETHFDLARALASEPGRLPEAAAQYEAGLRIAPDDAQAHDNLGRVLVGLDRRPEAIAQYELALQIDPDDAYARANLDQLRPAKGK
jgi:tetratricopeptide (TPR) repeat protein